jgi:predicted dehydrogenase
MKGLVIGYGSIGKRHIENLSNIPNMKIIVNTKRNSDEFLENKNCTVYASLNLCIDEKPDFAIISNVTSLHIETAIKLANAGIHFLMEKPLSHNENNIKKLITLVRKKKLITLIGCNLRFEPCIIKIKEIITRKKIGKVLAVQSENSSYLPDWHPYEKYKEGYAAKKELGGGVVLTSIHELDYLYWIFGKITDVFSITGKFSDLELLCDDMSSILLKFKAGIVGEVHLDFFQRSIVRQCKIIGTKGIISCDVNLNRIKIYNPITKKWSVKLDLKNYDKNEAYKRELDHFIKCVQDNKNSINDVVEGANILKIALSIIKSSKIKKSVLVK